MSEFTESRNMYKGGAQFATVSGRDLQETEDSTTGNHHQDQLIFASSGMTIDASNTFIRVPAGYSFTNHSTSNAHLANFKDDRPKVIRTAGANNPR